MKTTTYKCDVCHDELLLDDEKLIGFDLGPRSQSGMQVIRRQGPNDCERHICLPCLRGLAQLAAEVREK